MYAHFPCLIQTSGKQSFLETIVFDRITKTLSRVIKKKTRKETCPGTWREYKARDLTSKNNDK